MTEQNDTDALREMVEKLQQEALVCKHPGCICTCGHKSTCSAHVHVDPSLTEGG